MSGKTIISKGEMISKIAAVIRARDEEGSDLVIGARTDARAMLNALQVLKNDELSKVGELGINWSEFNELIGVRRWRQLEKEFGPGKCGLQYRKHRL